MAQWIFRGITHGGLILAVWNQRCGGLKGWNSRSFWCGSPDEGPWDSQSSAIKTSLRTSGAMSPPQRCERWFTNPMNSIVLYISTTTHSYWSYVHQLSYHKSPINHKSHEIPVFVGKCSACSNCSQNKPLPRCRGTYEDIHHSWWISRFQGWLRGPFNMGFNIQPKRTVM